MSEHENDQPPEMLQPCHEWHELITAAASAGYCAARELALRCSARHLDRAGSVAIHVEPLEAPAAVWLQRTGQAVATESGSGVLVPVALTAADLHRAADAPSKARSLRVAHAYAVAYDRLLAEEAGVATEIRLIAEAAPRTLQSRYPSSRLLGSCSERKAPAEAAAGRASYVPTRGPSRAEAWPA